MSQLRGSQNYIWSLMDVLGQGATGAVYRARHKKNGEVFAVKTFNHLSQMRPISVQMREFEVLKKLDHKNIVRLLAIEEETSTRSKVLIMELCTGGSLYNMLDNPENSFGILESEFFNVLNDLASGMKHIRDQGIVHRDIKPGNIMRYIDENGRSIYKLTDFGAARELQEEEEFMSLYGTEEYLYPDIYERAVLRRPSSKMFDGSVDLWSLGVTLYHLATGQLPFRPFGGRKNKETMYQITADKQPGVISGYQETENGPIKWSTDLPVNCRLSLGARCLVRPLFAGLMETNPNRMWSFDMFFEKAKEIFSHQVVHVFSLLQCEMLHVYLKSNDSIAHLQDGLASQTKVLACNQRLLFENCDFSHYVTPLQPIDSYPKTSHDSPIFLFYNEQSDCALQPEFTIPALPPLTEQVNLDFDCEASKTSTNNMILCQRSIATYIRNQYSMRRGASMYLHVLEEHLLHMMTYIQKFIVTLSETGKRLTLTLAARTQHQELSDLVNGPSGKLTSLDLQARFQELNRGITELQESLVKCHEKVIDGQELSPKWGTTMGCSDSDFCESKIRVIVEEVSQTWVNFKRDKSLKKLSHNEQQIHRFEKHKMGVKSKAGRSLAERHCHPNLCNMFQRFQEWYSVSYRVSQQLKVYDANISTFEDLHSALITDIDQVQVKCITGFPGILGNISESIRNSSIPFEHVISPTTSESTDSKMALLQKLNLTMSQVQLDSNDVKRTLSDGLQLLTKLNLKQNEASTS